MKRLGGILSSAFVLAASSAWAQKDPGPVPPARLGTPCGQSSTRLCIPLDGSFTVVRMDSDTGGNGQADPADPCQRNDDNSSASIPLTSAGGFACTRRPTGRSSPRCLGCGRTCSGR